MEAIVTGSNGLVGCAAVKALQEDESVLLELKSLSDITDILHVSNDDKLSISVCISVSFSDSLIILALPSSR